MLPGVILVMIQTYIQLRFKFRNISDLQFKDSPEVEELRHEIHVWKRAAASLSAYSKDEELVRQTLMKKVNRLKRSLKKRMTAVIEPAPNYQQTLANLQAKVSGIRTTSLSKRADQFSSTSSSTPFGISSCSSSAPLHCCLSSVCSSCTRCRSCSVFRWAGLPCWVPYF